MSATTTERDLYASFASLLAYPTPGVASAAVRCAARLVGECPDAARLVESFARFADSTPFGRLEETYTAMFELDATTPPYVGYHLFGESYKRSAFLLRLKAACRAAGVDPGTEVADHVAIVLALLGATEDEELRTELAEDALVPVLERMLRPARERDAADGQAQSGQSSTGREAYLGVLRALELVLAPRAEAEGGS